MRERGLKPLMHLMYQIKVAETLTIPFRALRCTALQGARVHMWSMWRRRALFGRLFYAEALDVMCRVASMLEVCWKKMGSGLTSMEVRVEVLIFTVIVVLLFIFAALLTATLISIGRPSKSCAELYMV